MALRADGEQLLQQKVNEAVDRLSLLIDTTVAQGDTVPLVADLKLLLFTCFQLYSENDIQGAQGSQDAVQQIVTPGDKDGSIT